MEETLYARAYKDILDQHRDLHPKYYVELRLSPAFYNINKMALFEALMMRLARIFDNKDNSAGIGYLMKQAQNCIEMFPKNRGEYIFESDGQKCRVIFPLKHLLRECEKCYFKEKVQQAESFQAIASAISGLPQQELRIEVTVDELFVMYRNRLASLGKIIDNLRTQRNKIYTHNDRKTNFDVGSVYTDSPLYYKDIDTLLEFAQDFTIFCYESLSGENGWRQFGNIDDWENTLMYAKKGIESSNSE